VSPDLAVNENNNHVFSPAQTTHRVLDLIDQYSATNDLNLEQFPMGGT